VAPIRAFWKECLTGEEGRGGLVPALLILFSTAILQRKGVGYYMIIFFGSKLFSDKLASLKVLSSET
jgi:hypothetical protein